MPPAARTSTRKKSGSLTMADLAAMAGVSSITVSRALAGNPAVSSDTAEKIKQLAKKHGYAFNVSARNLKLRSSRTVAVIVEMRPSHERPMSGPYPLDLLGGISQELTSNGYCVLLATLQARDLPSVRGADAVILLGQGAHADAVDVLAHWNMPLVVWGAESSNRRGSAHVTVGSDNARGGALAAERFLALGRRRIGFVGDDAHAEVAARLQGFSAVLETRGIKVVQAKPDAFTVAAGAHAAGALLKRQPKLDALFAASDLLAIGAVRALVEHGREVPQDVSVIGYDDSPLAATYIPALSSVHQNLYEGGVLLARKALALVEGKRTASETLPTNLVVRAT